MNINRHNYEEFFLLFADNELCAADRKAVEFFVAENPDLKKELQLLLQTVSNTDVVVFDNKELLMRPAITPLQEQLLLYIDNEQMAAEAKNTQQIINTNAEAAKEFASLQQTKLQPDTAIVFTNKKELYRKEKGRVVRIAWWRVAAAAVLLGFGTWGVLTMIKPAPEETGVVTTDKTTTPAEQTNTNKNIVAVDVAATPTKENTTNSTVTNSVTENTAVVNTTTENNVATKNILPAKNTIKQQTPSGVIDNNVVKKETNNLPQPLYKNFNNNKSNQSLIANVTPIDKVTENVKPEITNAVTALTNAGAVNGYAINTSFGADKNETTDEGEEEGNRKRTKLGGFIRKVKRLVERNTNAETPNSIKVASFDIALNK